jgi:predicted nucleic acid-binding Zn ribbon protein
MHCSACGKLIENDARFCGGCGRSIAVFAVPPKKTSFLTKVLAAFFGLIILGFVFGSIESTKSPTGPPTYPAEKKHEDERLQWTAGGAILLRKGMRNPDSFKLTSALVIDRTDAVCYGYRAQNGFGGMNVGRAVLTKGGKFKTDEMEGFSALWNKECAHKTGTEEVSTIDYVLEHMNN